MSIRLANLVRPSWPRLGRPRIDKRYDPLLIANRIRQPRSHRRRDLQRFVDAAEIVPDEIERQRMAVVLNLL